MADKLGGTPLHAAALAGHEEACRALIGAGADPSAKNKRDQTAACLFRDPSPEMAPLLG